MAVCGEKSPVCDTLFSRNRMEQQQKRGNSFVEMKVTEKNDLKGKKEDRHPLAKGSSVVERRS